MKALIGLFLALIVVWPVHADMDLLDTRTFRVVLVCAHAVDCDRAERVFELGVAHIQEFAPVRFRIVLQAQIPEDMTGDPGERMDKWILRTTPLLRGAKADMVFVAIAPFPSSVDQIDFEAEQVAGMASGIGVLGREPSFVYAKVIGNDRIAARVAAHEIGHLLGGWHMEFGIMGFHLGIVQTSDQFSFESIYQIREHLRSLP